MTCSHCKQLIIGEAAGSGSVDGEMFTWCTWKCMMAGLREQGNEAAVRDLSEAQNTIFEAKYGAKKPPTKPS